MTGEEHAAEWRRIQSSLTSEAFAQERRREIERHCAWMNLTFGMTLTYAMTPEETTQYFHEWNETHGYPSNPLI